MKIPTIIIPIIFLIFSIFLSSCSGMNSKFDCNAGPGGTCQPMDQINKAADRGAFNIVNSAAIEESNANLGYPLASYIGRPIRTGETVQRIWLAPFEDQDGNYHEPSYVYTVVKKSRWIGDPVKEVAAGE